MHTQPVRVTLAPRGAAAGNLITFFLNSNLLTSEFGFDLPDELIAQHLVCPRDHSRLMVIDRRRGCWEHRIFHELPDLLRPGDLLVRNNSRVVRARLIGRRATTGGKWEGLFVRELPDGTWEVLAKTRGRPVEGEHIIIGNDLRLVLTRKTHSATWIVEPCAEQGENETTCRLLERFGQIPLPPYIRHGHSDPGDEFTYQTVYAHCPGSVAAPTAGLHFTEDLFERLANANIRWVDLVLHVGLGTFEPIKASQLEDHRMHAEWAELSAEAVTRIQSHRSQHGRVIAVGTTSARVLETASAGGALQPFHGETSVFIRPGHVFRGFDALITNFHLPHSSLLVLVSTFAGLDLIRDAYAEAVRARYRFYSYGDAMLII